MDFIDVKKLRDNVALFELSKIQTLKDRVDNHLKHYKDKFIATINDNKFKSNLIAELNKISKSGGKTYTKDIIKIDFNDEYFITKTGCLPWMYEKADKALLFNLFKLYFKEIDDNMKIHYEGGRFFIVKKDDEKFIVDGREISGLCMTLSTILIRCNITAKEMFIKDISINTKLIITHDRILRYEFNWK